MQVATGLLVKFTTTQYSIMPSRAVFAQCPQILLKRSTIGIDLSASKIYGLKIYSVLLSTAHNL